GRNSRARRTWRRRTFVQVDERLIWLIGDGHGTAFDVAGLMRREARDPYFDRGPASLMSLWGAALSNLASQRIGTARVVVDPFAEQVLELLPRLRSYAMALSRSGVEADDLVQETVLKALRARDRFEPGTNLVAWLFKILRNTFYNDSAGRRHTVQDVEGRHAEQVATAPEQEWRLRYAEMLQALSALRPHHRDALLMV